MKLAKLEYIGMAHSYIISGGKSALALLAAAFVLGSGVAQAQQGPPQGPPPEAGAGAPAGPPASGRALPPGAGDAPPSLFGPPPPVPMTPAQELVDGLTPPMMGIIPPRASTVVSDAIPSADPHDLTGTWIHDQALVFRIQRDMYDARLPYNMAGARVMERRVKSLDDATPYLNASAICRPPGQQWQMDLNMPFQIFHGEEYISMIFEEYHGRWNIVMDAERHPRPDEPEYMGYSVAHWNGDTLIVETDGYRQGLWLDVDGTPFSEDGRLVHRIRKVDHGDGAPFMEVITTVHDERYYTNPWSIVRYFSWRSDLLLLREYDCEEQVGDPYVHSDAGLIPEPEDEPDPN